MSLQQDAIYVAPDGRHFRAKLDNRQYDTDLTWTLTPTDSGDTLWRDSLERQLYVHRGRVVRFDFKLPTLVVDTGWTEADLRRDGP
jgi:hypothetical protein